MRPAGRKERGNAERARRPFGFSHLSPCIALLLTPVACAGAGVSAPPATALAQGASPVASPGPPVVETAASEEDAEIPISANNPSWGSRTALVTIVEFGDLECPFCARAAATLARVRETYGPDAVRVVWKNDPLPFHPNARPAAEAAAGVFALAGSGAFWKFCDAVLHEQGPLGPAAYERWAKDAGVADVAAFRAGLERHDWAGVVDRDASEGRALGVFGTPSFFVNGLPLAGAVPFPTFQGRIDEQLRQAEAKLATGTKRDRLYAELTRYNRTKAAEESDRDDDQDDGKTVYYKVPVGKSPVRGSSAALVTLIEFADYQCPYCVRTEPTLKTLRDEYGDKLRVVFKDTPLSFHARAEPAAEAALEVRAEKGDASFWGMHDELLGGSSDLSDAALVSLATRFGARAAAVHAAISGHVHRRLIEGDTDVAEDFDADGTPHFFINGRRLVGAQPKEKFEAIIDEEIRRAEGMIANGVKPESVYDALVHDGKGAAQPETKLLPVALPEHDPSRGQPGAKVTVHEWSDFQCPFCKRAEPTLEEIAREYGARVRIVWHDLPLPMHADARLAARAAREAMAQRGERGFWTMHDELLSHQDQLKRADLDGYARTLRLDIEKWNKALDGDGHEGELVADKNAADGMDITGTPAFVIVPAGAQSGYYIGGAQTHSKFHRLIERALAEAK